MSLGNFIISINNLSSCPHIKSKKFSFLFWSFCKSSSPLRNPLYSSKLDQQSAIPSTQLQLSPILSSTKVSKQLIFPVNLSFLSNPYLNSSSLRFSLRKKMTPSKKYFSLLVYPTDTAFLLFPSGNCVLHVPCQSEAVFVVLLYCAWIFFLCLETYYLKKAGIRFYFTT